MPRTHGGPAGVGRRLTEKESRPARMVPPEEHPAMSIEVTCPACGAAYNLNDKLGGKKVRCKSCGDTFVVGNRSEGRPSRRDRDEDDPDDRAGPARKSSFPVLALALGGGAVVLLAFVGCAGFLVYGLLFAGGSSSPSPPPQASSQAAPQPVAQPW